MKVDNLHAERDLVVTDVNAIRRGAAEFSQLLAEGALESEEWDLAALVLARCRDERKRLDDRLKSIDASVALMWDCEM